MNNQLIRHGGDIQTAMKLYGGKSNEWLDLSTGISPWSYPVPKFDDSVWRKLPQPHTQLLMAASKYYQCEPSQIVATPGSQLAIRLIPHQIESKHVVAVPLVGYQEHAKSWRMAGHSVIRYKDCSELSQLVSEASIDSAVVINPNNPTGEIIAPDVLALLSEKLNGILIVDEAFSDLDQSNSMCEVLPTVTSNIVILKSVGKFFGLAGARIGFAIGTHSIITKLNQLLAPWSIAGPSLELATRALNDINWQVMQIERIAKYANRQRIVIDSIKHRLHDFQLSDRGLFFTIFSCDKTIIRLHRSLAEQKIWSRVGDPVVYPDRNQAQAASNWLRLSLAGDHIVTLSKALESITKNNNFMNQL